MNFITPPRCQGRIVEVSYAAPHDGTVIRRTHDRSDRTTVYHVSQLLIDDECDWWNHEPKNKRWRKLTRRELEAYGLA